MADLIIYGRLGTRFLKSLQGKRARSFFSRRAQEVCNMLGFPLPHYGIDFNTASVLVAAMNTSVSNEPSRA